MLRIQGIYREGHIELDEPPRDIHGPTPVIVTFVENASTDLRALGIDEKQAADLRTRLVAFAEDWDSAAMSAYDDYDTAKSKL